MTEAMPFLQKTILLSYDPRSLCGANDVSLNVGCGGKAVGGRSIRLQERS